jgi:phosphoglycolate phosphatase
VVNPPAPARPAGVVFDLDGTLVDSRQDLATAINALRGALGLSPLSLAEVTSMVGEGAPVLLRRALPESVSGTAFEDALARFLDLYHETCLAATRPYGGVEELLAGLAPRYPLAVLTNKPERHSRRILAGLGLLPRFALVVGGDTLPTRKPDPDGLRWIAASWRTSPRRLLLVGDSAVDADTAAAAGSGLALVSWGYGRPEQLAGVAAWHVDSPAELLAGLG